MNVSDQSRSDQTRYRNIKGVLVVSGYHYGCIERRNQGHTNHRHGQIIRVPYINDKKEYSFRVTKKTHNLRYCKVGHTASVMTRHGKRNLVISKVLNAIGSKAVGGAMNLRPVVNFRSNGLTKGRWGYLYQTFIIGGAKPIKKRPKKHTVKKFKIYYCKPKQSFTERIAMDGYDKVLGGLKDLKKHYNDKRHLKLNGLRVWRVFKGTNLLKRVDNVKTLHANTGTHGDYNSTSSQLGQMKTAREWLEFLQDYLEQLGLSVSAIRDKRYLVKYKHNIENLKIEHSHGLWYKDSLRQAEHDINAFYADHPHLKEKIRAFLKALVKGGKRFNGQYCRRYLCHQKLRVNHMALSANIIKVHVKIHMPFDVHFKDEKTIEYIAIYKLDNHELVFSDNQMMFEVVWMEKGYLLRPYLECNKVMRYIHTHTTNMHNGFDVEKQYHADTSQDVADDFFNFLDMCRTGYNLLIGLSE